MIFAVSFEAGSCDNCCTDILQFFSFPGYHLFCRSRLILKSWHTLYTRRLPRKAKNWVLTIFLIGKTESWLLQYFNKLCIQSVQVSYWKRPNELFTGNWVFWICKQNLYIRIHSSISVAALLTCRRKKYRRSYRVTLHDQGRAQLRSRYQSVCQLQ